MQTNLCLFDVFEFYRHDCHISESSFVSLTTNMLHNLFCDTVIFSRNFHLRLAIVDSADKQLNISSVPNPNNPKLKMLGRAVNLLIHSFIGLFKSNLQNHKNDNTGN